MAVYTNDLDDNNWLIVDYQNILNSFRKEGALILLSSLNYKLYRVVNTQLR